MKRRFYLVPIMSRGLQPRSGNLRTAPALRQSKPYVGFNALPKSSS